MIECPICGRELTIREEKGWRCKCEELVPFEYENFVKKKCVCGLENCD